ncbi:replicative DNA helicase [Burkholderia vietnamiensis]|uniref:replicative DNA helicase n=1 Tax=Burkholderia vietnamiensis TaxID=60552 RepID=UPI0007549693|nr:replicative DNA helicase [Burkholderia vietnamiensis]KVR92143.1 replicative DNA helicase [Burkholderia vietnamiensis]MCA8068525.1 replicative DNA helicase [Burkholderia vietnamiensis]
MSANDLAKAVPHSVEAEQAVIGILLNDNDAIDRIGDLRTEHFYRGDHRALFAEIVGLIANGVGVDIVSLFDRLRSKGRAEDVGGLSYLNALAQNAPSAVSITRNASIVRDRAQKRGLLAVASEMQESVAGTADDAGTLIDRAAAKLEALGEATVKREPKLLAQALTDHINLLERRSTGGERVISTGYDDLDRALNGGLRPGWSIILAARPGMGKTSLALNIAAHAAVDHGVLFLSMEMPESELIDRNIASLGRVPLDRVMNAPDDNEFWDRVTAATLKMRDMNLHIDDQASLRLLDVRSKARMVKRKSGLDVLIVDYLQLMQGEGSNRNAEIEGISRGLKALAKELDIAVIALAQLNRQVEQRANRTPMLSDLRDSGSIEQDADAVLFIHREEVANPDASEQWRGFAQIRVAKFRHGRTGDVPMTYSGEFVRFENHSGAWPTHTVQKSTRSRGFE